MFVYERIKRRYTMSSAALLMHAVQNGYARHAIAGEPLNSMERPIGHGHKQLQP